MKRYAIAKCSTLEFPLWAVQKHRGRDPGKLNFNEKMLTVGCVPDGHLEPRWRGKVHRGIVRIQHVWENYRKVKSGFYPTAALRSQLAMFG